MNDQYQALYQTFRWLVPTQFNIAEACCHRWASSSPDARRIAIYYEDEAGNREVWTYARLAEAANQLANGLIKMGVNRGDRVGVVLGQRPETVVAHMAIYSVGAVVLPLSALFGPEALETRLRDSRPVSPSSTTPPAPTCWPSATTVPPCNRSSASASPTSGCCRGAACWPASLPNSSVPTRSSDPAILLYTSGTTGAPGRPAAAQRADRQPARLRRLAGLVPQARRRLLVAGGLGLTGGMMDALLPTLYFGHPIVGTRGRFSAERAFELMERYQVTNTFLFPTALKMMMKAVPDPRSHYQLALRAIMSAGESVGETVFGWCEKALGITPNEMFGQTEMNYLVGNSNKRWPAKAGSMGRPTPATAWRCWTSTASPLPPAKSARSRSTGWTSTAIPIRCCSWATGATRPPRRPSSGRLVPDRRPGQHRRRRLPLVCRPRGRRVQVGRLPHRPGRDRKLPARPSGRGQCGCRAQARPERGAVVKAYVVLTPEFAQRDRQDIIENLQEHVRERLAPYEYPKEIEFVDELPMTTTGKILRRLLRQREADRALAASKGSA